MDLDLELDNIFTFSTFIFRCGPSFQKVVSEDPIRDVITKDLQPNLRQSWNVDRFLSKDVEDPGQEPEGDVQDRVRNVGKFRGPSAARCRGGQIVDLSTKLFPDKWRENLVSEFVISNAQLLIYY